MWCTKSKKFRNIKQKYVTTHYLKITIKYVQRSVLIPIERNILSVGLLKKVIVLRLLSTIGNKKFVIYLIDIVKKIRYNI